MKKNFELILFTSSTKLYCDGICKNVIENEESFFDYKLFKHHITSNEVNIQIKNLDILLDGRDLKDIVIIDNKSYNYFDHVSNGIPIIEYLGDKSDTALFHLKDYLLSRILNSEDVRKTI